MTADHFSGHAADYARHRPRYPPELFDWLAVQCPRRELAWDGGTGNGQAAQGLAPHFRLILATDRSAEQIAQAEPAANIDYRTAPAEASGLPDASCDLVTVAQALHWFCTGDFYAEVERVLRPDGLFAAWTYTLLRGEPELDAAVGDFHTRVVGPFWPPERRWVDLGYDGMPFPFAVVPAPTFEIRLDWTLADLLAYLRTWSATQRYMQQRGEDPTRELGRRIEHLWATPDQRKTITWPLALRCGRLP